MIHTNCYDDDNNMYYLLQYRTLKRDMEGLQEELEISNLDPKEAHTKFVARVNSLKMVRKTLIFFWECLDVVIFLSSLYQLWHINIYIMRISWLKTKTETKMEIKTSFFRFRTRKLWTKNFFSWKQKSLAWKKFSKI